MSKVSATLILALGVVVCALAPIAHSQTFVRKNIDNLTADELAAYEHAIQIMMDRSEANPYDKTGYLWQAWVHNCTSVWVPNDEQDDGRRVCGGPQPGPDYKRVFPGMCEHGNDLFLAWHRAEFYYFEQILRETDPNGTIRDSRGVTGPSTANVTVPYWNWTRAPSGDRYPSALENPNSPLFHSERSQDPIDPNSAYPFSSRFLIGYLLHFTNWNQFGGYPNSSQGGYGDFEAISHNPMHGLYMSGDMSNPRRAAFDPGFFSFHAYIDLVFEQWIEINGTDGITSKTSFLRGDQPGAIMDPPNHQDGAGLPSMGQVEIYLDTERLGYEYEVRAEDEPASRQEIIQLLRMDPDRPAVFGESTMSVFSTLLARGQYQPVVLPDVVRTVDYTIPSSSSANNRFFASFERNEDEADVSYQLDVYLYPKSAPFDADSEPFRSRYLVRSGVHWGSGTTPHHDNPPGLSLDITREVRSLINSNQQNETWNLSMAVSMYPALSTFGTPTIIESFNP